MSKYFIARLVITVLVQFQSPFTHFRIYFLLIQ